MARRRTVRMMLSVTPELRDLLGAYGERVGVPAATASVQVLEYFGPVMQAIVDLPRGPVSVHTARDAIAGLLRTAVGQRDAMAAEAADAEAMADYHRAAERLVVSETEVVLRAQDRGVTSGGGLG